MARRGMALTRTAWMKHMVEAKVKDNEEKAAAARKAFEATFRDLDSGRAGWGRALDGACGLGCGRRRGFVRGG